MSVSLPSKSKSTPPAYSYYSAQLNKATGGRLQDFAREGTPELTAEQIQAYGGLGATRTADTNRARAQAIGEISADPNLTIAQRQRSTQLSDQDYQARLDAIAKETEAGIAGLAQYNNALTAKDMELLAQIFYGAKGAQSKSSGGGSASYSG